MATNAVLLAAIRRTAHTGPPDPSRGGAEAFIGLTLLAGYLCYTYTQNADRLGWARYDAFHQGQGVEDFRAQELRDISSYWNPHYKFCARRYLEQECEVLSLSYNKEKRKRGEPEAPVYQPVEVRPEWGKLGKTVLNYFQ